MRTIWKGYLKISLVTIPVKMYNATTKRRPIRFNLLHEACNTRIKEIKFCPKCDKALSNDEIVKGYQYGKDAYVIMEEEDFQKAQQEGTDAIEVFKFVDGRQISPIFYVNAHYLVPDGKAGAETFALFHKAMEETGKNAMGKVVMRNKESLLTIGPYNGTLIAYSLHYPEEVLDHRKIYDPKQIEGANVDKKSLDMAGNIIENLSGDFTPEAHEDEYTKTLEKIIEAKVEGEEVQIAPPEEEGKVINLMEALKKSVKETEKVPKKGMAKAGGKKKEKRSSKKQKKA
jgi:DNA end-binding protein Ku